MIEMSAAYGISIGGAVYRPLCADCVEKLENRGAPKISQM
jgi:hypothetical protein